MSPRRELSDEERALWSGFVRTIKPLRRTEAAGAAPSAKAKPALSTPKAAPPPAAKPVEKPTAAPAAALAPFDRRLKQRVARGREAIDGRLDLHGMTQQQAHTELLTFLQRHQARGARIVLIVTGKGSRGKERDLSVARGVLRRQVPLWLALPEFRSFIVGFEEAHVGHGGEGALYVRLRRAR
jgi:DNA-nicking Smr family endonuclease